MFGSVALPRSPLARVAVAVLVTCAICVPALTSGGSAAAAPGDVTQIDAAAQAGMQAYFDSLVPNEASALVKSAAAGLDKNARAAAVDARAAAAAASARIVSEHMTGNAAARQNEAVDQALQMAVPHQPDMAGAPTAVVNVGGGVRDFVVRDVRGDGNSATLHVTLTSWLVTDVYYLGESAPQVFSPVDREADTITMSKGTDGVWRVADFTVNPASS